MLSAWLWFALWLRCNGWQGWWVIGVAAVCTAILLARKIVLILPIGVALIHAYAVPVAQSPRTAASVSKDWFTQLGEPLRQQIRSHASGVSRDAVALTLGITDGDTTLLSDNVKQQFKLLSLTHLTAVSGTNCAILVTVVALLLGWFGLRRRLRTVVSLGVLAGYLVLVGNQPSVLRAALMAIVTLAAIATGTRHRTVSVLSLAVVVALIIQPDYAGNLGFQLSVAATIGVVFLAPMIARRLAILVPKPFAAALAVAVAAQVACLPILVTMQTSTSAGSILANLLAEPAVFPATVLGLLSSLLRLTGIPLLAPVADFCFQLATIPSSYLLGLASFILRSAPNVSALGGGLGVAQAIALLCWVVLWGWNRSRFRALQAGSAITVLLLFAAGMYPRLPGGVFAPKGWVMVACDVGQGDATVIHAGGAFALIDTGKDPVKVSACLNRLGVGEVALLVLTHFDLDHIGAVNQVISQHRVSQALLTQYPDSRPGAAWVEHLLAHSGIPVTHVALGATGSLGNDDAGSLSWLALTPHSGGQDSVDSNDGSIAMFWHNAEVNIFTMADLPATGQRRIMDERATWWQESYREVPTILKLSHHGSADQEPSFLAWVHPQVTTISVGAGNSYGHPTQRALNWLKEDSAVTLRTDLLGSISITPSGNGELTWGYTGAG